MRTNDRRPLQVNERQGDAMDLLKSAFSTIIMLGACDRTDAPPPQPQSTSASADAETRADGRTVAAASLPNTADGSKTKTKYVCPMHPEVALDAPGLCPKSNMKLERKTVIAAPSIEAPARL